MSKNKYPDETTQSRKKDQASRKRLRAFAGVMATGLIAACSSGTDDGKASSQPEVPTTTTTPEVTTTTSVEQADAQRIQLAKEYIADPGRNEALKALVDQVGAKMVELAKSKKAGDFHFRKAGEDTPESEGQDTEGWGYLQHNPEDGGYERQLMALVYVDENGEIDLDRGVKMLGFPSANGDRFLIESADRSSVEFPEDGLEPESGWAVSFMPHKDVLGEYPKAQISSERTADSKDEGELYDIDTAAQIAAQQLLLEL